jgi:hypothetical protein
MFEMVAFGVGITREAVRALKEADTMVGALIGSPHHVQRYLHRGLAFMREIRPVADVMDRLIDETIDGLRRAASIRIGA